MAKEDLGINPYTGKYTSDPGDAYLRPLPLPEQSSITPEVQEAFKKHLKESNTMSTARYHSVPEKLFEATGMPPWNGTSYFRVYYRIPTRETFSLYDVTAELFLTMNDNESVDSFTVDLLGEPGERKDKLRISHWANLPPIGRSHTSIDATLQERDLRANYDNDQLHDFLFKPNYDDFGVNIFFEELQARGKMNFGDTQVEYDKENGLVKLKRETNGEIRDEITIPTKIDSQQITQELIPAQLQNNPLEADPEHDHWKTTDLKHDLGIDWQRPN